MKPTSLKLAVAVLLGLVATQAAHATDAVLTGDASVNSAHPTTNYGALSNLYVGNGTTSLLQFDLSVLPSGTTASPNIQCDASPVCEPGERGWIGDGVAGDLVLD